MMLMPTPSPRRCLGELTNSPGVFAHTPLGGAKSFSNTKQTPVSAKSSVKSHQKKKTKSEKPSAQIEPPVIVSIFDRTGTLDTVRGPNPPAAEVFGQCGVLERERGATPLQHKSEGREVEHEAEQTD